MAEDSPPDWPIGYPCLPKRFLPRVRQLNSQAVLDISPSDKAVVRDHRAASSDAPSRLQICLLDRSNKPIVIVNKDDVEIGTTRKFGNVVNSIGGIPSFRLVARPSHQQTPNIFDRTVLILATELWNQQETLSFLPYWFTTYSLGEVHRAVNIIIEGTKRAGVHDQLNDVTAKWSVLKDAGRRVDPGNMKGTEGLYFIDYWHFNPAIPGAEAMRYVGKTNDMSRRRGDHTREQTHSEVAHYRKARDAQDQKMYPWCLFEGEDHIRSLAEQLGVLLFETYNAHAFQQTSSHNATVTDIKWYESNEATACMAKLSEDVFAATGWLPPSKRRGYGMTKFGLNTSVPLTEPSREVTSWTKIVIPDKVEMFIRSPLKPHKASHDQKALFRIIGPGHRRPNGTWQSGDTLAFTLPGSEASLVPDDTDVWPVLERTLDGKAHEHHYGGLPGIGPFRHWSRFRTMAVAIVYRDATGTWKKTYMRRKPEYKVENLQAPGSIESFLVCTSLWMFIMRQTWSDQRPNDFSNLGIMRQKIITYDHLSQTKIFTPVTHLGPTVNQPAYKTEQEIIDEMRALDGIENVDGRFGRVPHGGFRRNTCDRCHLAKSRLNRRPCTQWENSQTCSNCHDMGIKCSWTRSDRIENNRVFRNAFLFRDQSFKTVNIRDPRLSIFLGSE